MKNSGKILAIILVATLVLSTMTMFVSADTTAAKEFDTNKVYSTSTVNDGTADLIFRNTGSNIKQTKNTADPAGGSNKVTLLEYSGATGAESSVAQVYAQTTKDVTYPLSEIRYDFYLTGLSYSSDQVTATDDNMKRLVLTSYVLIQSGKFVMPAGNQGIVFYETATNGETDLVFWDGSVCQQNKWYTVIFDINQAESCFDMYVVEKGAPDSSAKFIYTSRIVENQESWNPNVFSVNMFPGLNTAKSSRKIYLDNVTFRTYSKAEYSTSVHSSTNFNTLSGATATMANVSNCFPEGKRPAVQAIASGATFNISTVTGKSGTENDKAVKFELTSKSTYQGGTIAGTNNGVNIFFQNPALGSDLTAKYSNVVLDFDLYPVATTSTSQPYIMFTSYYTITDSAVVSETYHSGFSALANGNYNANKLKTNQWNHITVLFDNDTCERLIYVDGDHVLTDVLKVRNSDPVVYTRNIAGLQLKFAGTNNDAIILDNISVSKAGRRVGGATAEFAYVPQNASYKFTSVNKFDVSTDTSAGIYVKDENGNQVAGTVTVTNNAEGTGSIINFAPSVAPKAYSDLTLVIPSSAKLLRTDGTSYATGSIFEIPFHVNDTEGCYMLDMDFVRNENSATATVKVRASVKPANSVVNLYAASFNGNKLQSVDMVPVKPGAVDILNITATVNTDADTTETKAFLWDEDLSPVFDAIKK